MNHSIYGFFALKRPDRAQKGNTNYKSNSRCQNADKTLHTHFHSFKNNWQKNKRIKTAHSSYAPAFFEAWNLIFRNLAHQTLSLGTSAGRLLYSSNALAKQVEADSPVRELIAKHDKDGNEKVKRIGF